MTFTHNIQSTKLDSLDKHTSSKSWLSIFIFLEKKLFFKLKVVW